MYKKATTLAVLTGSAITSLLLMTNSIQLLAFAPTHQQPQPLKKPSQPVTPQEGFNANGTINSIIYLPKGLKYVAGGQWNIEDDGRHVDFITNMTWYPEALTNSSTAKVHTHAIKNFKLQGQSIKLDPNNVSIKGTADVLTNGKVSWRVPILIKIVGNTLEVSFTGNDPNSIAAKSHFGGQNTVGIAKVLTACSDQPLPNMVILPACNFQSLTAAKAPSHTETGIPPFFL